MRRFSSLDEFVAAKGEHLGYSDWHEVTQEQVDKFADATGDHQWIHTDPERAARESPSKSTIAHGFLSLSLLAPLFESALYIGTTTVSLNYGLNRVRFTAPVLPGDRIRARFTLAEYTDLNPGAQITWNVVIERAGGVKPALIAEWIMRRYP